MATIGYNPTNERPFAREGARVFVLKDGKEVLLNPGINEIEEEALKELQEDSTFKQLIEFEAINLNANPTPAPATQPPLEIPPPSPEIKATKSLRSP